MANELRLGNDEAETKEQYIKSVIGEAIGAGSVCWTNPERAGIFLSERAVEISNLAFDLIWGAFDHESS